MSPPRTPDLPVRCARCGEVYARRYATGLAGLDGTWLCANCLINGDDDATTTAMRRAVERQIDAATREETDA
jgi:hypothetical protein